MPSVRFNLLDSNGRDTSRTWHNTQAAIADVLTDAGVLAALLAAITDLQIVSAVITFTDPSVATAGNAPSNIDAGVTVQVLGADGFRYPVNIPDMPEAKISSGAVSTTDADLVAFFDEFAAGGTWRVNLRNPTAVASIIKATLDK